MEDCYMAMAYKEHSCLVIIDGAWVQQLSHPARPFAIDLIYNFSVIRVSHNSKHTISIQIRVRLKQNKIRRTTATTTTKIF